MVIERNDLQCIKLGTKKTKVSGNDYILAIGNHNIKLIGAADQSINVIDYAGNTQTYNESKAYAELFVDDKFITSEFDTIIELRADVVDNHCEVDSYHEVICNSIVDINVLDQRQGRCNTNG